MRLASNQESVESDYKMIVGILSNECFAGCQRYQMSGSNGGSDKHFMGGS